MKQNFVQYAMVALLVVGAYMVGVYKTKVDYLEKGTPGTVAQVAGDQAAPEEKVQLTDDEWQQVLGDGYAYAYGEESAPVTMVEFTDYECPFCARYFDDTYSQIKENYVDTGKVRYVFRDLPLPFHSNAEHGAVAARCAGEQGKYLAMHDKLFGNHDDWSEKSANGQDMTETFIGYAGEIGLDTGKFRSCVEGQEVLGLVQADELLASQVGASGTPTFIINGQLLVGAQPYSAFQAMIDASL